MKTCNCQKPSTCDPKRSSHQVVWNSRPVRQFGIKRGDGLTCIMNKLMQGYQNAHPELVNQTTNP